VGHGRLPKRKGALNERNQRANRAAREGSARSTCALLAAPVCGEDVCATTARGVLDDDVLYLFFQNVESAQGERAKCAQEPAEPARRKTRRENCTARECSAHSTNAFLLKHSTCPWVVNRDISKFGIDGKEMVNDGPMF